MRMLSQLAGTVLLACVFLESINRADENPPSPHKAGSLPKTTDQRDRAHVSAEDREFWSFRPLEKVLPPKLENDTWSRNDIDRFVLAKLKEKALVPNPATEQRQLIRRVYFDLIGLPPRPEEIDAFVRSTDPDAYPKLIDRLLANSHYGERWARHWLDVSRFAESHGFEHDYDRPYAYHFRDFVIQALNRDLPYNLFLQWQLAGDEIAPDEPLALMATGFLGAGVFPTQITANEVERTRYDALDDMSATMGTAMLGLTIGCARCHDHKFDPIPTADYYRLLSTFTTTVRSEVELDLTPKMYKEAKARFERDHAPLATSLEHYEQTELGPKFRQWLESRPLAPTNTVWTIADDATVVSTNGTTFRKLDDGSFLANGKNPDSDTYTIKIITKQTGITAFRVEALADDSLPKHGPGRADNGNFALSRIRLRAARQNSAAPENSEKYEEVRLVKPVADFEQNTHSLSVASSLDDKRNTGWAVDGQIGKSHAAVFHCAEAVGDPNGTVLSITLEFGTNTRHSIGRLRLAFACQEALVPLKGEEMSQTLQNAFREIGQESLPSGARQKLLTYFKQHDSTWLALRAKVDEHLKSEPREPLVKVQICSEGSKMKPMRHNTQGADFFNETYFLNRGNTDQKNGVATQSFLQVLMRSPKQEKAWQVEPPAGCTTSYRRRSLANWITDIDYGAGHLAARVMVNRIWQHHFGRGIVPTPNDFGSQGQRPSNPELLDWLAGEFIRSGWSIKHMHRLIMTSATYLKNTQPNPDSEKSDPLNEYLARRTPQRLEAEVVRDSVLATSGLLDERMFGPGTLDPSHKRRSIYFMIKRSQLVPMMQLFDAPEPLVSIGARPETTIAPQALLFLNSPQLRQSAIALGNELQSRDLAVAIDRGFQLAIGRHPTTDESRDSFEFLESQAASYCESGRAKPEQPAFADFAQTLFGLNEFIYIP
jgi:hypothetical protein